MAVLQRLRFVIYVVVAIFAFLVLCLAGNSLSLTQAAGGYFYFDALAVASAVLTIVIIVATLVIDAMRAHAFMSWTAVELGWLSFLCVLWLGTAADDASVFAGEGCAEFSDGVTHVMLTYLLITRGHAMTVCSESMAVMGFSFLIWIMLLGMLIYLLVFGIRAQQAGQSDIWKRSAAQVEKDGFNVGAGRGVSQPGVYGMEQQGQGYGAPHAGQYAPTYGGAPPGGQAYTAVPNVAAGPGYGPTSTPNAAQV